MGILINNFSGIKPKIDASLLPNGAATYASNVDFSHGSLMPFNGVSTYLATGLSGPPYPNMRTMYGTASGKVVGSLVEASVARQITQDQGQEWAYWTYPGSYPGEVSMTAVSTAMGSSMGTTTLLGLEIPLGMPVPAVTPSAAVSGSGSGLPLTRAYVVTWVSEYGEESAPSDVSNEVQVMDGQTVTLTLPAPTGLAAFITYWRIYRTDVNGNWRYVDQVAIGTWSYTDNILDISLGEVLQTTGWLGAPDNLAGLKNGPNGLLCGFFGNTVCFSQPYAPYAWPVAYQFNVEYPVVAVQSNSGGWIVATEGLPYFIYGSDPSQMSMSRINARLPCIAPKSMVDMGDFVLYASPDGLVAAQGMEAKLITKQSITPSQFRSNITSTLLACYWQGKYMAWAGDGSTNAFIYYPDQDFFVTLTLAASALVEWLAMDDVYVYDDNTGNVEKIGGGSAMSMDWKSKRYSSGTIMNVGAAMVDAVAYPVGFSVYVDDGSTPVYSGSVASRQPFKLPAGYMANSFIVEITGTNEVHAIYIGQDIDDCLGVGG